MKTALITGASDGIGQEAARQLARAGWQLAIIGRNPDRTRQVAQELGALHYITDFASLTQVKRLADQLLGDFPRMNLLACNAGGIFSGKQISEDGLEMTFQVNHLAHFLLCQLLLPRLVESGARVISTSSMAHRAFGLGFDVEDLPQPRRFNQHLAYGHAKLANILFTSELQKRHGQEGITAFSFHPGMVLSSFSKGSSSPMRLAYTPFFSKLLGMISPEEGADTLFYLAEGEPGKDLVPGAYYVRRKPAKTSRKARDPRAAALLWETSLDLCARFLK